MTLPGHQALAAISCSGQRAGSSSSEGARNSSWYARPFVGAGAIAGALMAFGTQQADNCGIIGVVGTSEDASKYLMEGLAIMRNRG